MKMNYDYNEAVRTGRGRDIENYPGMDKLWMQFPLGINKL